MGRFHYLIGIPRSNQTSSRKYFFLHGAIQLFGPTRRSSWHTQMGLFHLSFLRILCAWNSLQRVDHRRQHHSGHNAHYFLSMVVPFWGRHHDSSHNWCFARLYAGTGQEGLALIFVFITGIGDGLAEPVGITWGRHKYDKFAFFA